MKYQHSISATYVTIGEDHSCMMLHPRDSNPNSPHAGTELTLHPNLETALSGLDHEANDFFEENPEFNLVDVKQFHSPDYKLSVFNERRPAMVDVRDVTRVLIYTKRKK